MHNSNSLFFSPCWKAPPLSLLFCNGARTQFSQHPQSLTQIILSWTSLSAAGLLLISLSFEGRARDNIHTFVIILVKRTRGCKADNIQLSYIRGSWVKVNGEPSICICVLPALKQTTETAIQGFFDTKNLPWEISVHSKSKQSDTLRSRFKLIQLLKYVELTAEISQ